MHVLRRSSSSYRLAMRLSSSVLRRSFSRDFVHRRDTTGSPWNIRPGIKPQKAGISLILLPHQEEGRRLIKNQLDSARFSRISKIPSNQQDYLESARFLRIGQTLSRTRGFRIQQTFAHGFTPSSHISPQLSTAGDSAVSRHLSSRDTSDFLGFVGNLLWA